MKRWVLVGAFLAILFMLIAWRLQTNRAAAAAQTQQQKQRTKAAPVVAVTQAQVSDIVKTFDGVGTVEAPLDVKLSSKVTGRVLDVRAQPGDHVNAGDILVRIDPSEIEAQVEEARANAAQARYRLIQAQLTQNPTNVQVGTQINQQQAAVVTAQANLNQVEQSYSQQVAAAQATVTDAQGRIDSAQANITNAEAAIGSANANLADAQAQYDRVKTLVEQGAMAAAQEDTSLATLKVNQAALNVAKGQLNAAQAAYRSAVAERESAQQQAGIVVNKGKADIESARAQVSQAKAGLRYANSNTAQRPAYQENLAALQAAVDAAQAAVVNAEAQLQDTEIRSPVEGFVTSRLVDPGTVVTAGQTILAVRFIHSVWVTVQVPEEQIRQIAVGQAASLTFDALPGQSFVGRIAQIPPSADPNTRQFPVRIALDNSRELIKPGMFARVTIVTQRIAGATTVPPEAVKSGRGGSAVFVLDSSNTAHRRPVVLGARDPNHIAILDGVQPGEKVVVLTAGNLKDGETVRPGGAPAGHRRLS